MTSNTAHARESLNGQAARRVVVKGKRMVMVEEREYDRLLQKADEWEPSMPSKDKNGNYPALESLRVSLARRIIRDRRRLGLTQVELARRARMRLETLRQIEQAAVSPSVKTVEKIEQALVQAERDLG